MKKFLLLTFTAITFTAITFTAIISIIVPCKLYAVDISAGAAVWYSWYKPGGGEKVNPAFFYGPALSVKFNDDYNLTFVYSYGEYEYNSGRMLKHHDSDIALNYRLNDYCKIFGGIKYRKIIASSNEDSNPPVVLYGIKTDSIGPGLGFTAAYPLVENTYLIGTGAGLFLWRKSEYDLGYGDKDNRNYTSYGYNLTMSIVYYIAPASTVINLGGRYQCFIDRKNTAIKDTYYGITLTATYSFNI
ncbi:MAG: hypothetical protein FWF73_07250 [Spirochaetes bacterium]|nr:hypothetical protein [Spirochaetota bacterium]